MIGRCSGVEAFTIMAGRVSPALLLGTRSSDGARVWMEDWAQGRGVCALVLAVIVQKNAAQYCDLPSPTGAVRGPVRLLCAALRGIAVLKRPEKRCGVRFRASLSTGRANRHCLAAKKRNGSGVGSSLKPVQPWLQAATVLELLLFGRPCKASRVTV